MRGVAGMPRAAPSYAGILAIKEVADISYCGLTVSVMKYKVLKGEANVKGVGPERCQKSNTLKWG